MNTYEWTSPQRMLQVLHPFALTSSKIMPKSSNLSAVGIKARPSLPVPRFSVIWELTKTSMLTSKAGWVQVYPCIMWATRLFSFLQYLNHSVIHFWCRVFPHWTIFSLIIQFHHDTSCLELIQTHSLRAQSNESVPLQRPIVRVGSSGYPQLLSLLATIQRFPQPLPQFQSFIEWLTELRKIFTSTRSLWRVHEGHRWASRWRGTQDKVWEGMGWDGVGGVGSVHTLSRHVILPASSIPQIPWTS